MTKNSHPLLLSLKPVYADLVFRGLKTAELRRKVSKHVKNRDVYVYVSSPVMELRGGFRIGNVWEDSPENIWGMVSDLAGVDRQTFDEYYAGKKIAYALEIKEVWEYDKPLNLEGLRERFERFVVPQSYRFLTDHELRSIPRLKKTFVARVAV